MKDTNDRLLKIEILLALLKKLHHNYYKLAWRIKLALLPCKSYFHLEPANSRRDERVDSKQFRASIVVLKVDLGYFI